MIVLTILVIVNRNVSIKNNSNNDSNIIKDYNNDDNEKNSDDNGNNATANNQWLSECNDEQKNSCNLTSGFQEQMLRLQ